MAKPFSIVPPREPLGFVDGKPVEISRVWWRYFSSQFVATGGGQPGGGGNDNLNDLFDLAFSTISPAGTDVDSRFSEIDLLLQAGRPDASAAAASPYADTLMLLTSHPVQGSDPRVDVLMSAPRQPQTRDPLADVLLLSERRAPDREPRADLLLPAGRRGTDFDAVTAELRELIMAIRPQRVPSASDLGLGTLAFQNAPLAVAFGGTGDTGTAWATYTPTITAGSGAFTTVSATGRWKSIGKTVFFQISITITANGTAATNIVATLPVTSGPGVYAAIGRETAGQTAIDGIIAAASTTVSIRKYDGTYPGATGAVCNFGGCFESA